MRQTRHIICTHSHSLLTHLSGTFGLGDHEDAPLGSEHVRVREVEVVLENDAEEDGLKAFPQISDDRDANDALA